MRPKTDRNLRQFSIRLDLNDPRDAAIWAHLDALAAHGQASEWIRTTLHSSLQHHAITEVAPGDHHRSIVLPMPTREDRRKVADLREAGHAPDDELPAGYDSPIARALRTKQARGVK